MWFINSATHHNPRSSFSSLFGSIDSPEREYVQQRTNTTYGTVWSWWAGCNVQYSNLSTTLMFYLIPRLHDITGCQTGCTTGFTTGCTTGLTTGCIGAYRVNIQPVVTPVAKSVWQPVGCLFTWYSRLSIRFDNRIDNRLYRL